MMEDCKKNFILLSKVAKEKKYAQEYLGLLARRGDIGSIRIRKRWYTKMEWFSEFLADADMRKAEMKSMELFARAAEEKPTSVESKVNLKIISPMQGELKQKESKISILESEKETVILPRIIVSKPIVKKSFVAEKKIEITNLNTDRSAKPVFQKAAPSAPKVQKAAQEKKIQPLPAGNFSSARQWAIPAGNPSPNFATTGSETGFFPKFAFSMSVVLLLVLLFEIGWVYKSELKKVLGAGPGIVAGAEGSKISLDVARESSAGYLGNMGDKAKENISFSRVLIRAAAERDGNK